MQSASILGHIEVGDVQAVRGLLDAGADPNEFVGEQGDLALCWAAAHGRSDIVELLIERGAQVDAVPSHGLGGPALRDALFANETETARALVSAGAEVDFASAAALGVIDRVRNHDEDHAERWGAFLGACRTGQIDVVQYLVPRGIDVAIYPPGDEWGGIGASGLHWAASGGHEDLVRWLVAAGTPVDIVDDTFGNTPLGWVLLDGDEAMARLLVGLGAEPSRALT